MNMYLETKFSRKYEVGCFRVLVVLDNCKGKVNLNAQIPYKF